jgi:diguanylate cyclase (GGDEF)-like protein
MSASVSYLQSKSARLAASGAFAHALGIPDGEYTPRVRDAIASLAIELDVLRRELRQTQRKLEQVETAADQDQLVPILNRRAFVRALSRHIAAIDRYATPASLVYFDLDGFKNVNDTFGHAAGDAALQYFATALLAHTRESDAIGRLGGDEFGVLLCHATLEQASAKADNLAEKLRAAPAIWNDIHIAIAFSYGVFELKSHENVEVAMARADAEMYARKRAGRQSPPDNTHV